MQQAALEVQMQQAQANVQKTLAEAEEEKAKAMKWASDAMLNQPTEFDAADRQLNMAERAIKLEKTKADVARQHSETARNAPEVEHLKSETILNLAKAKAAGREVPIRQRIQ